MKLRPQKVGWKPHPGSQIQFLECPVFECLLEGTRGGGKTDVLLMSFAQFVGVGFGAAWTGILFRETYPQLADVVKKTKRWFRLFWPNAKFNESTYVWTFPKGEQLLLRQGVKEDDYWNFHGHEYPWIGFEELTNWRSLAFYEMMHSCCRSSQLGMPRMVRATTNPYGRGHAAVKERFRLGTGGVKPGQLISDAGGRQRTHVHSSITENTTLLAADPEYWATISSTKDPNRRKAWAEGCWDIAIGSFLEHCWKPEKHIVKPFQIPSSWKVWRSMDWGFSHPYAVLWFAMDNDGKTFVWREMYGCAKDDKGNWLPNVGTKETPEVLAKRIAAREVADDRVGLTVGASYAGTDMFGASGKQYGVQKTHAEIMRINGVKWQEAWTAKGSRAAGAMEVIRLLENDLLFFFSSAIHCIRTIPALAPSADNQDDVDTEDEDHAWDALRYGVMRRRAPPIDSVKEIGAAGARRLENLGDGTYRMT